MRLTLPQVVEMARNQSISARQAATTKETKYWEYRTFQSNYKPQLTLTSNFPAFNRTFQQVIQPDGTVVFQPIRNNNSSVGVSLSQNIARTGGSISIASDVPIQDFSDKKLAQFRNQKIGFIFQSYHLINDLRVLDNVELPLLYRKMASAERKRLASEALEKVGLSNRMSHYPSQLSGGQRQRVAIARAIVGKPYIILADEPTGNLDSQMGNEIMEILEQLNKTDGTTIVMVTHDENMAKRTHRLVRLFDGSQVA